VGVTYDALGDTKKGLDYKLKALEMYKKIYPGNHQHVIFSLNNVGISYEKLGDKKKSAEYYNMAASMRENIENGIF
jgi:tetratricopeptide (TPR) repeat protein